MIVTSRTRLNMVIGHPLDHSQSPLLHQAVYQELGIDAVLLAQPHLSLRSIIHVIKTLSVELTAVTSPYKNKVIQYIDHCSPEVKLLQAANTLIQRNKKIYGYNTDIDGIAFALRHVSIDNKNVLVIGAGGAARAVGFFLKNNHANIYWLNRTQHNAIVLAKYFGGKVICNHELHAYDIDIIVNTTPVGLYPDVKESPLPDYIFSKHQVVFDMVYHPLMTQLLKNAQNYQATIISGLDMFIGQGLKQIELLTAKPSTPVIIDQLRQLLINNQQMVQI